MAIHRAAAAATAALPLLLNCGSSNQKDVLAPQYTNQNIQVFISSCGDIVSPSPCNDKATCSSCAVLSLDNTGVLTQKNDCIRASPEGGYDPIGGESCANYVNKATQLDADTLIEVKRNIIKSDPMALQDHYFCTANKSCSTDVVLFTAKFVIDGQEKTIQWTDGGPAVSADFTAILNTLHGIGM